MSEKPPATSADLLNMNARYRGMPAPKPAESGGGTPAETSGTDSSEDFMIPAEVKAQADGVRDAYAELSKKFDSLSPEAKAALGADLAEMQNGLEAVQAFYTDGELNLHAEHGDWQKVAETLNGALDRAAEISAKIDSMSEVDKTKEAKLEDFSPELVQKITELAGRVKAVGEDNLGLDAVRDKVVAEDLLAVRDWLSILKADEQTWARGLQSKLPENTASSEKVEHELKAVEEALTKIEQATSEVDKDSESSEQDRVAREAAATYWRIIQSDGLPLLTNNVGRWGKTGEMLISKNGADVKRSIQFFVEQDPAAFHNFIKELSRDADNNEVFERLAEVVDQLRGDVSEGEGEAEKQEVPAEILARATALGPRLELVFEQIESLTPDELRKYGWEARIKTSLRQMADYYNDPSIGDKLGEWSKSSGSWDKPLGSLDRWENIAKDMETKLGIVEEKTETTPTDPERAEDVGIPEDILDEAQQLSVQARAVAERCRTLSAEDRQKLHIRLFTGREFQQIANTYNAENVENALSDLRREAKDWQEVQQDIRGLAERVSKLQLDMDALGVGAEPSGTATKSAEVPEADKEVAATAADGKGESGTKQAEVPRFELLSPKAFEQLAALLSKMPNRSRVEAQARDIAEQLLQSIGNKATANELRSLLEKMNVSEEAPAAEDAAAPAAEAPEAAAEPVSVPDAQAEQQRVMEQAEQQRSAEMIHRQDMVMADIMALWKHIPAKQQQFEPMSWQDVRLYLQSHGGSLDGYRAQAMSELTQRNEAYKNSSSWKQTSEAGLQKDLLDKLLLEKKMLISKINEKDSGAAGKILAQLEIAQRGDGTFKGSFGQSEHPTETWEVNGMDVAQMKTIEAAKDDFKNAARDKGQAEGIANALANLRSNASLEEVNRLIAPLQSSSHFNFESVQSQIARNTQTRHDQVMAKLPNGMVVELIRNNSGDVQAAKVHQPVRQINPDTQLSIDDGRLQRTGLTEFDGTNLTGDRLGWGNNVEVYLATQDKNGADSGLLKIAHDNGQWRMVGKLDNEVTEKGQPVRKVLQIDRVLSEEDLQKIRLRQGEMMLVPGLTLPVEKVTNISLRYTGNQGKQLARNYDVLKALEKQNGPKPKNAPKSLRYLWHDQQLNNRGLIGRNAGRLKRWANSN